MRFAARLTIAIATLIGSAILCWGQQPAGGNLGYGGATPMAPMPARSSDGPSLAAPQSVPGVWVSDNEPDALPQERTTLAPMASAAPESIPFDGPYEDCDGSCDDAGDGSDENFGVGRFKHKRCFNDLWEEVHAHRRMWVEADYVSFWTKGNFLPPLVTTSPPGTPQAQAGVLPESATTAILFGNDRVDTQMRNGGRINFGYWLIDGEFLGVEGQYFALQQQNTNFTTNTSQNQIIARPFVNVDPSLLLPREDSALVSYGPGFSLQNGQGALTGSINIHTASNIQSANFDLRQLLWIDFTRQRRLEMILGYRFFRLDDSVTINDQSTYTPTSGIIPLTNFSSQDVFSARNEFNGGEIGLKGQSYHGRFQLELMGKIALGNNSERVFINGSNSINSTGFTTTNPGGLLAQPSNIGTYRRDVFTILPEANANLRYDITCNLRATFGYTFIYANRVQRSGDAIDRTLNPTQINGGTLVGQSSPSFSFHDTTFWAQGVNAGIEYRW